VLRSSGPVLVAVALLSVAGCGGALSPPDGAAGNGGTTGAGGTTGIGGSITIGDAGRDVQSCLVTAEMTAPPVPDVACRYQIPVPSCDSLDSAHIGVKVDGVEIPRDPNHTNGWDYTDSTFTAVDIYGATCDGLTNGALTIVKIVYRIILP
jgi:hypothetical protein